LQNNSLNKKAKSWSGRFSEPVAELVKKYTASVSFDKRLAEVDIQGSLAHAKMLNAQGIISSADIRAIEKGLKEILAEINADKFEWLLDLEDVLLNIE
jgi:argininosuccinate lyase